MLDWKSRHFATMLLICGMTSLSIARTVSAADKPNIPVIMGDDIDIGYWNISAYERGHDGIPEAQRC
jgi:hypothetical protein